MIVIKKSRRSVFPTMLIVGIVFFCGALITVEATDVLIASEGSGSFKKRLVKQLEDRFEESDYVVTVVDHLKDELDNENDADYSAVVIINTGVDSGVRPKVAEWLEGVNDTNKIIVVTTYASGGWEPELPQGVDGITTPSKRNEIKELVTTIGQKVDALQ